MSVRPAQKRSRIYALGAALLAGALVLIVVSYNLGAGQRADLAPPDRVALQSALDAPDEAMLRQVYATRGFQPIWMDGQIQMNGARQLVRLLETSDSEGLTPARYGPQALGKRLEEAAKASPRERMRTELVLTKAYIDYVRDLHTPAAGDDLAYTDPDLQPPLRDRAEIARQLAGAAGAQIAIEEATRMNGFYVRMRDALAQLRSTAPRDKAAETRLLQNLDRLRALPSKMGDRFVLVDIAANRLWLYENDRPVDSMKVVVGAADGQTPQMAALIRYAVYNPFWNVPPDLTRDIYAPRIAADLSALADLRMNAWSSFTANAQVLNPRTVDWTAVARGETVGWLRQRPGPTNSMGAVKFMLPNALGIYLHDSPQRELFDREQRFFSAGCIRVEDYRRLSRWLFRGEEIAAKGVSAEQRYDLPAPTPVYIVYLTARAENGAVQVQPDVYGRDSMRPPAAAGANPKAAPPLQRAAVPAPVPTAAAPKAPAPNPAASPVPPAATFERSPEAAAPASPSRPAPSPRSAPVPAPLPAAAIPKLRPAQPVTSPVAPAGAAVAQRPAPAPAPIRAGGACRIQAGVFSQRANADRLANAMKPLGDVRLTEMQLSDKVVYSVALVGLPSRKDAESALSRLNRGGGNLGARIMGCPAAAD